MHRRVLLVTLCVMLVLSAWPVSAGTFKQGTLPPKLPPAAPEGDGQTPGETSAAKSLYRNIEPMYVPLGNTPGLYVARANYALNLDTYYAVGGHQTFYWSELEPTEGNIQWHLIDNFIANWANKGKKAAFGISVYEGRPNERKDLPYLLVPDYVFNAIRATGRNPTVRCGIMFIPRYWDPVYLQKYRSFVSRLAARYNGDPRIEFIQIGVGKSSENIPCDPDEYYDGSATHYDATCVANAMIAEGFTSPSNKWQETVNEIVSFYTDHFTQTRLFLLQGAKFQRDCERDVESYHAVSRGVGLFPAEIRAYPYWIDFRRSTQEGCGKMDYVLNWSDTLESDGPIDLDSLRPVAFEGYGYMLGGDFEGTVVPDPVVFFWGIVAALSRHPDYITLERSALYHAKTGEPFASVLPTLEWASQYIGKRIEDTPSVWTILRETGYCYGTGCSSDQRVQIGNYNWWLRQDDNIPGGRTKPTTWMAANMLLDPESRTGSKYACEPACLNPNIEARNTDLPAGAKESWVCRRTDYATGNSFMYFKINDRYRNSRAGESQARITVTYLDRGFDRWQLEYDSTSGPKVAGIIQKTGSNQWRDAIFDLTDARFLNGMDGGADLRINCLDTGNEYIHKVDVRIGEVEVLDVGTISGRVSFRGRSTPPAADWVCPISVTLTISGQAVPAYTFAVTTDASGMFTLTNIMTGTYDIKVRDLHSLWNVRRGYPVAPGMNTVDMGTLVEGDADVNGTINILDFSILASAYGTCSPNPAFDPRADFNNSMCVDLMDFSLLATNYGRSGEVLITGP